MSSALPGDWPAAVLSPHLAVCRLKAAAHFCSEVVRVVQKKRQYVIAMHSCDGGWCQHFGNSVDVAAMPRSVRADCVALCGPCRSTGIRVLHGVRYTVLASFLGSARRLAVWWHPLGGDTALFVRASMKLACHVPASGKTPKPGALSLLRGSTITITVSARQPSFLVCNATT